MVEREALSLAAWVPRGHVSAPLAHEPQLTCQAWEAARQGGLTTHRRMMMRTRGSEWQRAIGDGQKLLPSTASFTLQAAVQRRARRSSSGARGCGYLAGSCVPAQKRGGHHGEDGGANGGETVRRSPQVGTAPISLGRPYLAARPRLTWSCCDSARAAG